MSFDQPDVLVKSFFKEIVHWLEMANGFDELMSREHIELKKAAEYERRRDMCSQMVEGICNIAHRMGVGDNLFHAMQAYEENNDIRSRLKSIQQELMILEERIHIAEANSQDIMTLDSLTIRRDALIAVLAKIKQENNHINDINKLN